jgi:hypothetical protein
LIIDELSDIVGSLLTGRELGAAGAAEVEAAYARFGPQLDQLLSNALSRLASTELKTPGYIPLIDRFNRRWAFHLQPTGRARRDHGTPTLFTTPLPKPVAPQYRPNNLTMPIRPLVAATRQA